MRKYPRRYPKNLGRLTTIRLTDEMREQVEKRADFLGISFSDFVRQSISRNLLVSGAIEDEVIKQTVEQTLGKR